MSNVTHLCNERVGWDYRIQYILGDGVAMRSCSTIEVVAVTLVGTCLLLWFPLENQVSSRLSHHMQDHSYQDVTIVCSTRKPLLPVNCHQSLMSSDGVPQLLAPIHRAGWLGAVLQQRKEVLTAATGAAVNTICAAVACL